MEKDNNDGNGDDDDGDSDCYSTVQQQYDQLFQNST